MPDHTLLLPAFDFKPTPKLAPLGVIYESTAGVLLVQPEINLPLKSSVETATCWTTRLAMSAHLPLQLAVRIVRGDLAAAVGEHWVRAGAADAPPGAHYRQRRRRRHLQRRQQLPPKCPLREVCKCAAAFRFLWTACSWCSHTSTPVV